MCFGAMRDYLPADADGNRAHVEIPSRGSARAVLEALGAPQHLLFAVLVDGLQTNPEEGLSEGAEVTLMPPFTGGDGQRVE